MPTIISMSISAIYNIVDSWFVGHISTFATAGVGVAFSYQSIIQAVGFFFGHGSGNYMSRALGARDAEGAGKMAATGFISSFLIGLLFEFPTVILVLSSMGIVSRDMLKSYRKYAFIVVLLLSAIITPSDPFSMLVLAIPLYGLYEFSILICRRRKEVEVAEEGEEQP